MKTTTTTRTVTLSVDLDEHLYYANIDNGAVPDAESATYDGILLWLDGYKQACNSVGITVQVSDLTENV